MSQTVHFQGNPVAVAGSIPQAGSKAQAFTLWLKTCLTLRWASSQASAKC
jgi:peroxiredoxin